MLTRSSVPPSSSIPSPKGALHPFHYASAAHKCHSPSRISAPLSRRQSSSSVSGAMPPSPAGTRPKQHVGIGVATQSSAMEPATSADANTAPLPARESHAASSQPVGTAPFAQNGDHSLSSQQASATRSSSPKQQPPPPPTLSQTTSPNKRRNSQGPDRGGSANTPHDPSVVPKRAKAEAAPPTILPQRYELCPVEDIVVLIANMLGELIETNDSLALKSRHLTRFHSRTAPGISVLDYLHRLAKHATLTPPLLLSMVYYIDRLCVSYPDFTINTLTVHRFLITAATVAAKGLSDSFWNNSTYARVGGVRLAELKLLELEFLYRVDWKIVPNPEVLVAYYRGLVERCPDYVLAGEEGSGDEGEGSDEMDEDSSDDTGGGEDQAEDAAIGSHGAGSAGAVHTNDG